MEEREHNTLADKVLERIKKGETVMRPRWRFLLRAALLLLAAIAILFAALYTVSLFHFSLRESGLLHAPAFGLSGLAIFLASLPWSLILGIVIFIIALELIVRRYSFAYRKPLMYSVLVIAFIIVAGSIVAAKARVHDRFFLYTERVHPPFIGHMYRAYMMPRGHRIHPFIVGTSTDRGFVVTGSGGEQFEIVIDSGTRLPSGNEFSTGERVIVMSRRGGFGTSTIRAGGVMKARMRDGATMMYRFEDGSR